MMSVISPASPVSCDSPSWAATSTDQASGGISPPGCPQWVRPGGALQPAVAGLSERIDAKAHQPKGHQAEQPRPIRLGGHLPQGRVHPPGLVRIKGHRRYHHQDSNQAEHDPPGDVADLAQGNQRRPGPRAKLREVQVLLELGPQPPPGQQDRGGHDGHPGEGDQDLAAGQLQRLGGDLLAALAAPAGAGDHSEGDHGQDQVDRGLDGRLDAVGGALAVIWLASVAPGGFGGLPEAVADKAEDDQPQDRLAEAVLGQGLERPLLIGLFSPVHKGDLEGQDADQHIDQPTGGQPHPGGALNPFVVGGLPGRVGCPLPTAACAGHLAAHLHRSARDFPPSGSLKPPLVMECEGSRYWQGPGHLSSTRGLDHGRPFHQGVLVARPGAWAARAGMAAILAASRCSQRMPCGRRVRGQPMTSSPATIRSRRKSWPVSGSGPSSTCRGWTVVATTVSVPISPASTSNANSRSEKPPPLPTRAPSRLTATLPQTTRSTGRSSATAIRRPTCAEPLMEAARRGGTSSRPGSRRMKGRSSVRRGTAMYSSLPSARARARTGSWGASGLLLTTRPARHAGSEARRAAAAGAPAKLGIRPVAPGKRAARSRSRRAQTRLRIACLARAASSRPGADAPLTAALLAGCRPGG